MSLCLGNIPSVNFAIVAMLVGLCTIAVAFVVFAGISNGDTGAYSLLAFFGAWGNDGETAGYCDGGYQPPTFVAFKTYFGGLILGCAARPNSRPARKNALLSRSRAPSQKKVFASDSSTIGDCFMAWIP